MEEYELCLSHDDDIYVEIPRSSFHRIRVWLESKFDLVRTFEDEYIYYYIKMPSGDLIIVLRCTITDFI